VKKYIAVGEMFCRSVIVLFLLAIVLPALARGDLKTLLALFLKQKRVRTFTGLDPIARAGNTMAKRKRTITDLQNISPTAIYFFTGNKNQIFIFWT
jgi:hypothetical protein